ncbi:Hsp20/alpha crystallin family protein [Pseudenhygromyxa sp. WMMC2535]|uniref:Hsp20/alpha crystallin family protein n=1 Tax=Pseudenhygromyxa sp. WMMC2535 TaxID=2712867 RepID=UPI00155648B4|nr:Hsp20/alpha crystallin family protein [Pseudenhygromyxa sp. WMMC2535]NVB37422.1 Hsp20/alpha crystallin family protein [Pseudenhygromyxa sp. WMMC2535]
MLMHRFTPNDHLRTMDMLFDAMLPARGRKTHFVRKPAKLTLEEREDAFELRAELPGISPEDLDVRVGEDWVELVAERQVEAPEGFQAIRRERAGYRIERRVALPKRIDGEAVAAKLQDGQLTIRLPKHASAAPRTIAIAAA